MNKEVNFKFSKVFIGVAAAITLAGCSSSDSPQSETIVSVMDPYATDCTVTDAAGYLATPIDATNSPGRYKFLSGGDIGNITATGCTDLASGISLPPLRAPAPATSDQSVVTPITTIISAMMSNNNLTASQAEAAISGNFPDIDLLTYDPLAARGTDPATAIQVQSLYNQMTSATVMLQAAVADDAAVITEFADAYAAGTINLTKPSEMYSITTNLDVHSSVADAIGRINTQIDGAAQTIVNDPTADITAALTTMTAGVIVASDPDLLNAVTTGDTAYLDAIQPPVLIQTVIDDGGVNTDGFDSTPVTVDDGLTGTGSAN